MNYQEFLARKSILASPCGFQVSQQELNGSAFFWQRDIVAWALKKGRCALFEDCGLGKTLQQLLFAGQVVKHTGKPVMIFAPLAVVPQTVAGERNLVNQSFRCDIGRKFVHQASTSPIMK